MRRALKKHRDQIPLSPITVWEVDVGELRREEVEPCTTGRVSYASHVPKVAFVPMPVPSIRRQFAIGQRIARLEHDHESQHTARHVCAGPRSTFIQPPPAGARTRHGLPENPYIVVRTASGRAYVSSPHRSKVTEIDVAAGAEPAGSYCSPARSAPFW